ncbi:MAG: hypothetical protein JWO30_1399 [Fibrobacteres bacterium]|nr:hypothetical protein [Fibrobacterota bacterium]
MRFPRKTSLISACAVSLASALLWGCILGGTGTDTENGVADNNKVDITGISARVVDGEGTPLAGISLNLYIPAFRPDSGAAPASLLIEAAKAMVSDSKGYVTIQLKAAGKYVVEGVSAGKTVFFDTLAVPDVKNSTLFTFRTRAVRDFKGKVRLISGMRIDSGSIFIRGTGRFAKVDSAGNYDLGSLPQDIGRMAVGMRFASSPTSVREVTETQPVAINMPVTYTCKEVSKDSAARISTPKAQFAVSTDTAMPVPAKLDTSKVNLALKSCDTLSQGSVINVVTPTGTPGKIDNVGVPLLVVKDAMPVTSVYGTHIESALVVPYAECIPMAGQEKTSFDVQLQPTASTSDILIQDVADRCLAR